MAVQASDILIVGGGPAGSTCAWQLSNAGFKVRVVDKATFPRDKTCAGWITPPVVDLLRIDPSDYRREHRWQPITGFRCGMIGGRQVQIDYGEPISFGIRRCEFDNYLLKRSGVTCALGERVNSIERTNGQWSINEKYSAPMLVGAGGHFCPVAQMLRARRKQTGTVVLAQEIEFPIGDDQASRIRVQPNVPELFFCQDWLGYGWCFRKQDYLNIGLGRADARDLSTHVSDFCRFLQTHQRVNCDIPCRFHGHAYRLYDTSIDRLCGDGVLLAGDAAGLAYPPSGEGIRPAVESGLLAADVIAGAGGDYGADRLAPFAERIQQRFGHSSRQHSWHDVLPAAWLACAATMLAPTRWFARHVIMDRWFLRANERPLAN